MNSSAKTTAVSFLAAAALGAAVFMGCSVSSGTVDDTDGGTQDPDDEEDGGTNPTDSGNQDQDAGPATCETPQTNLFTPVECQACLEANCCTELSACFSLPRDEANAKENCDGHKQCLDECAQGAEEQVEACNADCEELVATPEVRTAYRSLSTCGQTNCSAECIEGD